MQAAVGDVGGVSPLGIIHSTQEEERQAVAVFLFSASEVCFAAHGSSCPIYTCLVVRCGHQSYETQDWMHVGMIRNMRQVPQANS